MKAQLFTLLAAAAVGTGTVQARGEYAEIARLRSMNETVRGIRSMADGEHYTILEGNNIVRYGYATAGQGEQMLPKPTANLVVTDYAFSPDERQILIASGARPIYRHSYTTDYFLASGNSLMPVLREAEAPRDASFSPDGKLIAYSDRNDLYVYDTAGKRTRRITDDGAWNSVINGTTDWVYEEEFGFTRAYAFSPDSRRIAYLRFDESEVPPDGNDALRRQALQPGLLLQIPQGRRAKFDGRSVGLRPCNRDTGAHRHGRRDRPVHSPHRLDTRRTALLFPPQPQAEHLRGDPLRTQRRPAHDLRRTLAAIRRARG